MHSGDLSELSTVNLSDVEREALLQVMQRAKVGSMYHHMNCVSVEGYDYSDDCGRGGLILPCPIGLNFVVRLR